MRDEELGMAGRGEMTACCVMMDVRVMVVG